MSSRLIVRTHHINPDVIGVSTTGAPHQLLIGPIDVGHYNSFSILYRNSATSVGFIDLQVQAAPVSDNSQASDISDHWVQVPTATLPQPSALGSASSVLTGPVNNAYKFIRVIGSVNASTTQNILSITITGHKAE